jgi:hypothetical protein
MKEKDLVRSAMFVIWNTERLWDAIEGAEDTSLDTVEVMAEQLVVELHKAGWMEPCR